MFLFRNRIGLQQRRTFVTSILLKNEQLNKTATNKKTLNWVDFFKIKKQERRVNVISGILTGFVVANLAFAYAANVEIDPTQMIFGIDPSMVIVGGCITAGFFGYLIGPAFGRPLFKLKHRAVLAQYNDKTRVFLDHVKKNRVDASTQSLNNPPPDYYGEKIGSLKQYKTWLRDSNAYRHNNGDL